MLESIRKRKGSYIIVFAFAAIILVFIFWGVGPSGDKKTSDYTAATVNGETIGMREYTEMYKRHVDYYKAMFKDQFNDELAAKLNLKQKTIDVLINRKLVIKDAVSQGIEVTEQDLQGTIKGIKAFQKDGVFDLDTYKRVLDANRLKPAEFEKNMRDDLLYTRIQEKITKDLVVGDDEVKNAYLKENRSFDFDYLSINPAVFTATVKVTDDEAKDYLKKNGSAFMEPLGINAVWAKAEISAFEKKVKVTDAEIKEYYEKNQKQFEKPESVAARHILVKIDPKAANPAKNREAAKTKAEGLLKTIKAGANFAELAKKNSDDTLSAKKGGDLGWFPRGMMVKTFEDAAFALKKGEVSSIVETDFGFHIITVYDKKETGTEPLKEVQGQIKNLVAKEKGWKLASETILALDKPFKDAKTTAELKKMAAARGLKSGETGLITEADHKAEITAVDTLRDNVFALRQDEVSKPLQTPQAFYLVKAVERVDPHVPDFSKVASRVREQLSAQKAEAEAKNKADGILKKALAGENLSSVARAEKLKIEQTGKFSMRQPFIQKLALNTADKPEFFAATKEKPYYPQAIKAGKNYLVFRLNSTHEADMAEFEKAKDTLKRNLLATKQNDATEKWIKALRDKAKVEIFKERL